jgi:hypothetical protein
MVASLETTISVMYCHSWTSRPRLIAVTSGPESASLWDQQFLCKPESRLPRACIA